MTVERLITELKKIKDKGSHVLVGRFNDRRPAKGLLINIDKKWVVID